MTRRVWSRWSQTSTYFYTNKIPTVSINQDGTSADPFIFADDVTPRISWVMSDVNDSQASYQLLLKNEMGTLLYDSGEVTSSSSEHSIPYASKISYGTLYQVEVRAKDQQGVWSSYDRTWIQSIVGAPSGLSAQPNNYDASISLDWNDSLAEGLQGYNVYRRDDPSAAWEKINPALVTESYFSDASVVSGVTYYYAVEAFVSSSQVSAKSSSVSAEVVFSAWFIGSYKFEGANAFSKSRKRNKTVTEALTRRITQDGGFQKFNMDLEIECLDDQYSTGQEKYNQLMTELEKTEILSLRDPFGNQWDVSIGDVDDEQIKGSGTAQYRVTVPLSEV